MCLALSREALVEMIFADRSDAGRRLLQALEPLRTTKPIVLALPRGGVPVAVEIARGLEAPLDVLIVRKIGTPSQPELAMGAVVDAASPIIVRNDQIIRAAGVSDAQFAKALAAELVELRRRRRSYVGDRARPDLEGRTVIVVDDGLATGTTMLAALKALQAQAPARIVVAIPVGTPEGLALIRMRASDIVCLETPRSLGAIGAFYHDFEQVTDAEVIRALATTAAGEHRSSSLP